MSSARRVPASALELDVMRKIRTAADARSMAACETASGFQKTRCLAREGALYKCSPALCAGYADRRADAAAKAAATRARVVAAAFAAASQHASRSPGKARGHNWIARLRAQAA